MSMIQSYIYSSDFRLIFTSSTSKTNTEFPGIFGGEPLAPYPISGGITNLRFSPSHILKLKMSSINSYLFRAYVLDTYIILMKQLTLGDLDPSL